jgi:hypothetical protein
MVRPPNKRRAGVTNATTAAPPDRAQAAPYLIYPPTYHPPDTYPLANPLIEVRPDDLIQGESYLIEGVKRKSTPNPLRFKGIFKEPVVQPQPYSAGIRNSRFIDVKDLHRTRPLAQFNSTYWKYYRIDAERRALFNQIFRNIGHPDMRFDNPIFSGPKVKAAPSGGKTIRNRRRSRRSRSLKRRNRSKRG